MLVSGSRQGHCFLGKLGRKELGSGDELYGEYFYEGASEGHLSLLLPMRRSISHLRLRQRPSMNTRICAVSRAAFSC